jgi:hypothetical protein
MNHESHGSGLRLFNSSLARRNLESAIALSEEERAVLAVHAEARRIIGGR